MTPIILGEADDPHVDAVSQGLVEAGAQALIINAARLEDDGFTIGSEGYRQLATGALPGGWIRRIGLRRWRGQTVSPADVEIHAWLDLMTGIARDRSIRWLTTYSALSAAENKVVQYRAVESVGLPVPRWAVTSDPVKIKSMAPTVVKPLGPGEFRHDNGEVRFVLATSVPSADDWVSEATLRAAPFIFQRRVEPVLHCRVVTVDKSAWVFAMRPDADTNLDWRATAEAHDSFEKAPRDLAATLAPMAISASRAMSLGFSSQDWIFDGDSCWFLDMNPAGQWMFLPDRDREIARAIAAELIAPSATVLS